MYYLYLIQIRLYDFNAIVKWSFDMSKEKNIKN